MSTAVKAAFRAWADYSRLRFVETEDHGTADIVISFGRYDHGDRYGRTDDKSHCPTLI